MKTPRPPVFSCNGRCSYNSVRSVVLRTMGAQLGAFTSYVVDLASMRPERLISHFFQLNWTFTKSFIGQCGHLEYLNGATLYVNSFSNAVKADLFRRPLFYAASLGINPSHWVRDVPDVRKTASFLQVCSSDDLGFYPLFLLYLLVPVHCTYWQL